MVKTHEALALALDALEKHYLEDAHSLQGKAITAIREALAEQPAQQQEPVAIGWYIEGFSCVLGPIRPEVRYEEWRPFYALRTPPQRTWVGLTDEEEVKLWESTDSDWELMKRVEAKLKEKNT